MYKRCKGTKIGVFWFFYYFLHFIVVMPVVGYLEKTDPIPMSISEPVLTGGAEPSLARKLNDKV